MWVFCTRLMDSTPPASISPASPQAMRWLAMAIDIRPEAHWRSTVIPGVRSGSSAASAAMRPML
ncbi:hypothetical protein D9M69_508630 [compost metagenome]